MRFIIITFALAACTDSYRGLSLDPSGGPPLGVGLVQRYDVSQELCEGGPDGGCGNPVSPLQLAAAVQSGTALAVSAVTPFDGNRAWIALTGVAEGSSVVGVTGYDDITTAFSIDVAAVASTSLAVQRGNDPVFGTTFPDVHGPVHAFTGSQLTIAQTNLGPDQQRRAGAAPLVLAAGTTGIADTGSCICVVVGPFDDSCECYTTGAVTGTAMLMTPLATLELDVVGADALADFTIDDSTATTLELVATPATTPLYLIPHDAAGHTIVGRGPEPVATIADPTIAHFYSDIGGDMRSLNIVADHPGTTTLDVTWGSAHKTFTVHVAPS